MSQDITLLQSFGVKVKEARTKAKMTQKELADKVGISHEWVCKIEKGKAKVISMTLIDKISNALDMKITWTVVDDLAEKIREEVE